MNIYFCPRCKNYSVSWDTLSRVFVCHVTSCSSWFPPPSAKEVGVADARLTDVAKAISQGRYAVTQSWFDRTNGGAQPQAG